MGYAFNQVCYQDTASALAAFVRSVPGVDSVGINTFSAAPTISADGLITWSISNRPLTDTVATIRTGTTQLPACSDAGMSQFSIQTIDLIAALFFAAILGFATGWKR